MTTPQPDPAGDLPPAAAAELARIRSGLPSGWAVARTWQDVGGGWVAEVTDQSGQLVAQVALFDPLQGATTEQDR
jgi:hypothetical protein